MKREGLCFEETKKARAALIIPKVLLFFADFFSQRFSPGPPKLIIRGPPPAQNLWTPRGQEISRLRPQYFVYPHGAANAVAPSG